MNARSGAVNKGEGDHFGRVFHIQFQNSLPGVYPVFRA